MPKGQVMVTKARAAPIPDSVPLTRMSQLRFPFMPHFYEARPAGTNERDFAVLSVPRLNVLYNTLYGKEEFDRRTETVQYLH